MENQDSLLGAPIALFLSDDLIPPPDNLSNTPAPIVALLYERGDIRFYTRATQNMISFEGLSALYNQPMVSSYGGINSSTSFSSTLLPVEAGAGIGRGIPTNQRPLSSPFPNQQAFSFGMGMGMDPTARFPRPQQQSQFSAANAQNLTHRPLNQQTTRLGANSLQSNLAANSLQSNLAAGLMRPNVFHRQLGSRPMLSQSAAVPSGNASYRPQSPQSSVLAMPNTSHHASESSRLPRYQIYRPISTPVSGPLDQFLQRPNLNEPTGLSMSTRSQAQNSSALNPSVPTRSSQGRRGQVPSLNMWNQRNATSMVASSGPSIPMTTLPRNQSMMSTQLGRGTQQLPRGNRGQKRSEVGESSNSNKRPKQNEPAATQAQVVLESQIPRQVPNNNAAFESMFEACWGRLPVEPLEDPKPDNNPVKRDPSAP